MTFIAQELSVEAGAPCELYEIRYDAQTWYYTSSDAGYFDVATSRTYVPLVVSRSNIIGSSDPSRGTLELDVERNAEFLELFRVAPPSSVVALTIKRFHRTDSALQLVVVWSGRILNVSWSTSAARLNCESIRSSVAQFGLRRQFQLQCPHVLYGPSCRASKALHQVEGTVTAMSSAHMTIPALSGYANNYFAGGYVEWTHGSIAATERRAIRTSQASTGVVEILGVPTGIDVGDPVRVYPGCDHTLGSNGCLKFSNTENYGGFPHTPSKNPFGGDPLY